MEGIVCAALICLGVCTPLCGGICYCCSRRETIPLRSQVAEAENKAKARRDTMMKAVEIANEYGETTTINMSIRRTGHQSFTRDNPVTGLVKVNT